MSTPFDPVRRRANQPAGIATRHRRRTHPTLHLQRNRPVADSAAARRCEPARRRSAVVLAALPRSGACCLMPRARPLLQWIGWQLRIDPACWPQYAEREETRREHLLELRAYLSMEPFRLAHYRQAVLATTELACRQTKASCWLPAYLTCCATGTSFSRAGCHRARLRRSHHPRQPAHL
jgi:hypothetical protein